MTWLIGALLAAAALAVVALPFLHRRSPRGAPPDAVEEVQAKRQAIYREAQVLHNDWTVGQVTDQEYRERLRAHRIQAALLLREEEQLLEIEERLEEEVLALRGNTPLDVAAGGDLACPNCGRLLANGVSECPACGAKVTESARG
jgi:rubrerythrin